MSQRVKGQFYHVEIMVSNLEKSAELYDGFLGWLGYQRIYEHKLGIGWGAKGLSCNFWAIQCDTELARHGFHRRRVGLNHIAFHADSKRMIDEFHNQYLLPNRIPVLYGGPKEYPEYSKGYYAVYFEDPDRIKLELAYVPVIKGFEKANGKSQRNNV